MSASSRRSIRFPVSKSGSTATTRPRAICSTTASSARPMCWTASTTTAARISASSSNRPTPTAISASMATLPGQDSSPPISCRTSICSIPTRLAFIATHYIYTDHAQILTGSAGASYLWNGTRFSASMIYGSGLRAGFANTDHLPSYTQVNIGSIARFQHRRADQADHAAVRCRQPVRQDLRDPGRLGHRRVRAAVRAAPRLLCRHHAEALSRGGRSQRALLQSGRIAPDTPSNAASTSSATSRRL